MDVMPYLEWLALISLTRQMGHCAPGQEAQANTVYGARHQASR